MSINDSAMPVEKNTEKLIYQQIIQTAWKGSWLWIALFQPLSVMIFTNFANNFLQIPWNFDSQPALNKLIFLLACTMWVPNKTATALRKDSMSLTDTSLCRKYQTWIKKSHTVLVHEWTLSIFCCCTWSLQVWGETSETGNLVNLVWN
jgi:hypothetical protein